MKRMKRHKVKKEVSEPSSSFSKEAEHDLAYYIHDRVELMHQVFSSLKYKELKAMAPQCVRHISIDDLQELCTEELLGISSKRLCAILDGAEPPSDTESSSKSPSPPLETISLDSISSDDEILSETSRSSKKKKHKHKHSKDKSKRKEKRKSSREEDGDGEANKASRAGLTVLELLELQARARAIRAQLQKEQLTKQPSESAPPESTHSSDNEVEIKEEPAEVVEISSEDEKPNVQELQNALVTRVPVPLWDSSVFAMPLALPTPTGDATQQEKSQPDQPVVKRVNNLVITIPQSKQTRKIKLNRSQATTVTNNAPDKSNNNKEKSLKGINAKETLKENNQNVHKSNNLETELKTNTKNKAKKAKIKKKKEKKHIEEDHDEITLQLSDSEKMDLLEDLDRKNLDNVSSSCTEDSESSSDTSEDEERNTKRKKDSGVRKDKSEIGSKSSRTATSNKVINNSADSTNINQILETNNINQILETNNINVNNNEKQTESTEDINKNASQDEAKIVCINKNSTEKDCDSNINKEINKLENGALTLDNSLNNVNIHSNSKDINIEINDSNVQSSNTDVQYVEGAESSTNDSKKVAMDDLSKTNIDNSKDVDDSSIKYTLCVATDVSEDSNKKQEMDSTDINNVESTSKASTKQGIDSSHRDGENNDIQMKSNTEKDIDKKLSDGELTDNESSEIEVTDLKPEVVCISDEEVTKKKKKKKDKKKKKSKKSDFRESSDQNFYKDANCDLINKIVERKETIDVSNNEKEEEDYIIIEDEILVLSDDSSCCEVDTYLSKEPTTEEIEALSLKIDEINRQEIIPETEFNEEVREKEKSDLNETEDVHISWKDRYLDSKKVKKVLTTANIFNALRKKNIELKKKLEHQKRDSKELEKDDTKEVDGSVDYYNTLQGSMKYVDPIKEKETEDVTRAMKRDAKQLLKMYKKLLKYNNINKVKDPNKKKKKRRRESSGAVAN